MRKLKAFLFFLVFLSACASYEDGDPDDFREKDFRIPSQAYSKRRDFLDESFRESGILRGESMDKAVGHLDYFEESRNSLGRALSFCYRKKFSKEKKLSRKLYRSYKKNKTYWNQIATCEFLKGNDEMARLFYNKSLSDDSSYAPPLNNLGVLYQREEKDQKALEAYRLATKGGPSSVTPRLNLGLLYAKYGFINQAKTLIGPLYRRNRRDPEVQEAMAYLFLSSGNLAKAIDIYSKMDEERLESVGAGVGFTLALFLLGKKEKASNIFDNVGSPKNEAELRYLEQAKEFFKEKL